MTGHKLRYLERGDGPVAVLVHGFPLDATLWLDQLEALAPVRRVVAVDLRGCGRSSPVNGSAVTMEQHASDIDHLCDALGADRIDLVGLSMGGYVALAFAELFGHRLRSLALVDTKAEPDTDEGRAGRDAMSRRVVEEGRAAVAADMATGLLAADASLAAQARFRAMAENTSHATYLSYLEGMKLRPDRTHILGEISCPSIVITGEHDPIAPEAISRAMAEALGCELVVIPGSAHLTPIETPDAVNDALLRFFAGVDAG